MNIKTLDSLKASLTSRTIKGIVWSQSSHVIGLVAQLGIGVVLARILFPEDFGLLGMVAVFSGFIGMFQELGLGVAIIQKRELTEEHLSSAFLINVGTGLLLSIIMLGLAPAIAYFYGEKRLILMTIVLGSSFFVTSLGITQRAIFTRQLEYKKMATVGIVADTIAGIAAILLALMGMGVWSLTIQVLVSSAATTIILWFWSEWKPSLVFCWIKLKELFGVGLSFMGIRFITYFSRNLDNLLIGKFLGAATLGFYGKAYNLMLMPIKYISWTLIGSLFPAFSIIQDDLPKVRDKYMWTTKYISAITFPMMMGLLILAPETIRVLYKNKWEDSIILLMLLCPVGLLHSISSTTRLIFLSQGRTKTQFQWSIVTTIITTLSFIIGLKWGVKGVAVAYCVISYALAWPDFYIPLRIIKLPMGVFLRNLLSTAVSSIAMALIVFGYRTYVRNVLQVGDFVSLISCFIVGVASYTIILIIFNRELIREFLALIQQMKHPIEEEKSFGITCKQAS